MCFSGSLAISGSWGSLVGVVTRLRAGRPRNCGSIPSNGKRFISSQKRSDHLWCPPGLSLHGWSSRNLKLTSQLRVVPRLRKGRAAPPHFRTVSLFVLWQLYVGPTLLETVEREAVSYHLINWEQLHVIDFDCVFFFLEVLAEQMCCKCWSCNRTYALEVLTSTHIS